MQLPKQTKNFAAKSFRTTHHQRSVKVSILMMSDGKTKSVYTSLYLSRAKINVTTVNNICFCHTQDIWRVLHLSAGQCPDTLSA